MPKRYHPLTQNARLIHRHMAERGIEMSLDDLGRIMSSSKRKGRTSMRHLPRRLRELSKVVLKNTIHDDEFMDKLFQLSRDTKS